MKEIMRPKGVKEYLSEERGAALIVALLLMVAVTVLGTGGMITSSTDIQISGNYKTSQEIFYGAEGGIEMVKGIIERAINDSDGGVDANTDTVFVRDLLFPMEPRVTDNDYDHNDSNDGGSPSADPDMELPLFVDVVIPLRNIQVLIDIDVTPRILVGFSPEFAGGYEGIGSGSDGGQANFYRVNSGVRAGGSIARSILGAEFRKIY